MASAGPNHLTAKEVCQSVYCSSHSEPVSDIEYVTLVDASFQRSLLLLLLLLSESWLV